MLLSILSIGFLLALFSAPDIRLQGVIVLLTVVFYVTLGIIHHLINHELTVKIMVEYILIGTLGISILFFAVFGGLI
jgi:intracellular septation protein A